MELTNDVHVKLFEDIIAKHANSMTQKIKYKFFYDLFHSLTHSLDTVMGFKGGLGGKGGGSGCCTPPFYDLNKGLKYGIFHIILIYFQYSIQPNVIEIFSNKTKTEGCIKNIGKLYYYC